MPRLREASKQGKIAYLCYGKLEDAGHRQHSMEKWNGDVMDKTKCCVTRT